MDDFEHTDWLEERKLNTQMLLKRTRDRLADLELELEHIDILLTLAKVNEKLKEELQEAAEYNVSLQAGNDQLRAELRDYFESRSPIRSEDD
jgi:regulator of replication initiation timing